MPTPKKPTKLRPAKGASLKQKNPFRKKKCVKATSFPCGYSCQPKTRNGKEVICGEPLHGQAKTYMAWAEQVAARLQGINIKRETKGRSPLSLDKKGNVVGQLSDKALATAEKIARKKGSKALEQIQAEQQKREKEKTLPPRKTTIAEKIKSAKTENEGLKSLTDRELDQIIRVTKARKTQKSKDLLGKMLIEKERRSPTPPTPEVKPESPQPAPVSNSIKKATVTDRQDILPPWRKSLVPQRHIKNLNLVQQEGVARAIEAMGRDGTSGFIMADGAGLGKSRQQLAIADYYAAKGKKVLIISPNAVMKPDYKKGKVTGSFDEDSATMGLKYTLNRGQEPLNAGEIHLGTYENLDKFKDMVDKNTVLLLDESHLLKNLKSRRTEYGMEMLDKVGGVLYASATPADKPEHLYYLHRADKTGALKRHMNMYQVETVDEDGFRTKKWTTPFSEKKPKPKGGSRRSRASQPKPKEEKRIDAATRTAQAISALIDDFTASGAMMRREISMKGVDVKMKSIAVPPEAHEIAAKIEAHYSQGKDDGDRKKSGLELLDTRRQLEVYKVNAAAEMIAEDLKKGKQILVFASRINESTVYQRLAPDKTDPVTGELISGRKPVVKSEGTIPMLRAALEGLGIDPDLIVEMHGQAKMKQSDALEAFQSGKAKIMIGTDVMGTGINADDTVGNAPRSTYMLTPDFSASEAMQKIGRTWRSQTASYPEINFLFSDLEIDQWGKELLSSKLLTLGAIVGGAPKDLQFAERLALLRKNNRYNPFLFF